MAKKVRRERASHFKRPKLKLIKNEGTLVKASSRGGHTDVKLKLSRQLPSLQQEDLILKYRQKARKLGRSILRRWHSRMDIDEVDSIVDLSLCEAVRRFDPEKGASFMTFLFYHLKGNLVRAVTHAVAATAIPLAIAEASDSAFMEGDSTCQSGPTLNAIELAEAISSQDIPQPDEALWKKELSIQSTYACEKLDALEREIVKRIFVHEQQIIDIAAALGYSRCHISRVKKKALATLHGELVTVVNAEDYGAATAEQAECTSHIEERVATRKTVYRRRPRSGSNAKRLLGIPAVAA